MLGRTMTSVIASGDVMLFIEQNGSEHRFYHEQDCCESVEIEDIEGDLNDLVGDTIILAEQVDSKPPARELNYTPDYETWTFYKFATAKGHVTVRWYGSSNGYYSESVDYSYKSAKAE